MNRRQRKKLAKRIGLPRLIRRAYLSAIANRLTESTGMPFTLADMDALMAKVAA